MSDRGRHGDESPRTGFRRRALVTILLGKGQRTLRDQGVAAFAERVGNWVLYPRVEIARSLFFESDLTGPLPSVAARIPLEIRPAAREDLETYAEELAAAGSNRDETRRRWNRGDAAILALAGRELAHVQWLAFRSVWLRELGVGLLLRDGEAYAYNAVTPPAWRGHGVHPAVNSFILHYLRGRGYTREILYVGATNVQSLKTQAKLGCVRTKTLWSFHIRGRIPPALVLGATRRGSPSFVHRPSFEEPSTVPGEAT